MGIWDKAMDTISTDKYTGLAALLSMAHTGSTGERVMRGVIEPFAAVRGILNTDTSGHGPAGYLGNTAIELKDYVVDRVGELSDNFYDAGNFQWEDPVNTLILAAAVMGGYKLIPPVLKHVPRVITSFANGIRRAIP